MLYDATTSQGGEDIFGEDELAELWDGTSRRRWRRRGCGVGLRIGVEGRVVAGVRCEIGEAKHVVLEGPISSRSGREHGRRGDVAEARSRWCLLSFVSGEGNTIQVQESLRTLSALY